jgi:hypothetical protein
MSPERRASVRVLKTIPFPEVQIPAVLRLILQVVQMIEEREELTEEWTEL